MRKIVVFGASSDLSRALLAELDRRGCYAKFFVQSKSGWDSHRDFIGSLKGQVELFQSDLTLPDAAATITAEIAAVCPAPDAIAFFQAPKFHYERFSKLDWSDFQTEIDLQLKLPIVALNTFLPAMAKRRSGKVLFALSSVTEGRPPAALSHYVTAKYAVLGLMRSLSQEYAAKNIQINGVSPSMVETKFLSDLDEKFLQLAAEAHPLKRNARVDDIVSAMSLLLTEGSDYMSGVNLPITGGG